MYSIESAILYSNCVYAICKAIHMHYGQHIAAYTHMYIPSHVIVVVRTNADNNIIGRPIISVPKLCSVVT